MTVLRTGSAAITLTASDVDGQPLWVTLMTNTAHGTLSGDIARGAHTPPLRVSYAPTGVPTNNTDSFTYRVQVYDGFTLSPIIATATVSIHLTPVYSPPVAYVTAVNTFSNQHVAVTLSGAACDGAGLTYSVMGQPANGTLTGTAPYLVYAPSVGYVGPDYFMFRVNDGRGFSDYVTNSILVWGPWPPKAPAGLAATPVSSHQINLIWSHDGWDEDGFHIENSEDNRHWRKIATVGPATRAYSNIKLGGNKIYYYRVRFQQIRPIPLRERHLRQDIQVSPFGKAAGPDLFGNIEHAGSGPMSDPRGLVGLFRAMVKSASLESLTKSLQEIVDNASKKL